MKKDIPQHKVEDVAIAVVPRENDLDDELWDSYIINLRENPIQGVLINSKGYGELNGEQIKTTVLRHFFEEISGNTYLQIEPIQTKLFDITNEYWVSFKYQDYMYDKKYVFVKGSLSKINFTEIPLIGRKGIMIK